MANTNHGMEEILNSHRNIVMCNTPTLRMANAIQKEVEYNRISEQTNLTKKSLSQKDIVFGRIGEKLSSLFKEKSCEKENENDFDMER